MEIFYYFFQLLIGNSRHVILLCFDIFILSCLCATWTPNITWSFDERHFNISFLAGHHPKYAVTILCESKTCQQLPDSKATIPSQQPLTSVRFKSNGLANNSSYRIRIQPLDSKGKEYIGIPKFSEEFVFNAFNIKCEDWNIFISPKRNPEMRSLSFNIELQCSYAKCFETLNVQLWTDITRKKCDGSSGILLPNKTVTLDIRTAHTVNCLSLNKEAIFRNLVPGHYCIRVSPNPCLTKCVRYGSAVTLETFIPTTPFLVTVVRDKDSLGSAYIWAIIVIVVLLLLVLGVICRYKWKGSQVISVDIPEAVELKMKGEQQRKLKVFIIYSHDSEFHKDAVCALARFLQNCWDVDVILDTDCLHLIAVNQEGWITNMLQYSCKERGESPLPGIEKKIIIVESEGAVKQQILRRKGNRMEAMESFLESLFISALSAIMSDFERCTSDYCHIFVVHLSYTPKIYKLDYIVPNRRYYLPDHLINLYNDIHCGLNDHKGNAFWLEHPSYKRFLQCMEQMKISSIFKMTYLEGSDSV